MRLPLTILSLVPTLVAATQSPLHSTSTKIVDVLSSDPNYTKLLSLLQHARLIPTLNSIKNCTLFAPTNDAIEHHLHHNPLWAHVLAHPIPDDDVIDNVHEQLRQQLLYHLLNETIYPRSEQFRSDARVYQTMLYPRKPLDPPSREPPPHPPWLPIPGGTLGNESQRLRLSSRDGDLWIGVDAIGNGGINITTDDIDAGNCVLLGISGVLEPPPSLADVVSRHGLTSYFNKVLTPSIIHQLNTTSELTLFLPYNKAWEGLDEYERLYLESDFAEDDLTRIMNTHAVVEEHVRYSDKFNTSENLTTLDGSQLRIVLTDDKIKVEDAEILESDIYASNGVLHLISDLMVRLEMTPEKYLIAKNCTSFVRLLNSTDLRSFINDTTAELTILAPCDNVLDVFGEHNLPEPGSEELRKMLQYHFIHGQWLPKKLNGTMLLKTALVEDGLRGGNQVLSVEATSHEKDSVAKSISFGGARSLGDPLKVNNTIIYFISRPIIPPADTYQELLPNLEFAPFLVAMKGIALDDEFLNAPASTLLIPNQYAFDRIGGLVSDHLLTSGGRLDLEKLVLHHGLDGVHYGPSLQDNSQHSYPSLEGTDVTFDRRKNGTIVTASGGWTGMESSLHIRDILTQSGVVHELSDILIPRSVDITVDKLVKAAKASTMANIITRAGMGWVLDSTAPPDGSPWVDQGLEGAGWTLLCPTDDAFKPYNLSLLLSDTALLRMIVYQHLIPTPSSRSLASDDSLNNNRPLALDDYVTYSTLRSASSAYGDIVFRLQDDEDGKKGRHYVVGIKGARGTDGHKDRATVLKWGRSTSGTGTGGVIQIDRVLLPYEPPWWIEYGAPSVVGLIGVVAIVGFFYMINVFWRRDTTEATYEPVGGFSHEDDD